MNSEYNSLSKDVVKASFNMLNSLVDSGESIPERLTEKILITHLSDDSISTRTTSDYAPMFHTFIYEYDQQLLNLSEYKLWEEYMENNDDIKQNLNVTIGTKELRRKHTPFDYFVWLLLDVLDEERPFEFINERFDESYKWLEYFFFNDKILLVATSPIENFMCELENEVNEIDLGDGLKIVKMDKEEVQKFLHLEGFFSRYRLFPRCALKKEFAEEKTIGEAVDEADTLSERQKVREIFNNVISALRIFKSGMVGINIQKIDMISRVGLGGGIHMDRNIGQYFGDRMTLSRIEVEKFQHFWHIFKNINFTKHTTLETSIRWFNYSYERRRGEDKLIDYSICNEVIFLTDCNKPEYRGELRYRLSLRGSFFLGSSPEERNKIFKEIREAYDLRSKIVHGGKYDDPVKINGVEISFTDFVKMTEQHLRVTFKKLIGIAKDSDAKSLVDWDSLILHD